MIQKLLVVLLLFTTLSSHAFSNKEIVIAGDNWCPVNCGEHDKQQGFMIDVARAALAKSGYTLKYMEMPWLRAIELAREGKIHGIVGAFKDDAPDFYFPQVPFLNISPNSLFTLKDSTWKYENIRSFNGVKVGVIKGYDYGDVMNTYIKSFSLSKTSPLTQLYGNDAVERSLKFLVRKRIDVYVDAEPVFWYEADKLGITEQVKNVGSISEPEPCFIAFSPALEDSQVLTLALDKGVILMKERKELSQIANQYSLPPNAYQ
jgi:polar amino acid transport system substrate-binding protein